MSSIADLLPLLKNKYVEISIGDEYEEVVFSDHIKKYNVVIYGKVQDIIGEFVILDCFYLDKTGQIQNNNIVYINSFNIKAMTEITNENNGLGSAFLSAGHNKKIRKILGLISYGE